MELGGLFVETTTECPDWPGARMVTIRRYPGPRPTSREDRAKLRAYLEEKWGLKRR